MSTTTLSSKGQTTIPIELRELWGLKRGDSIDFILRDNGEVLVRPIKTDVTVLKGLLADKKRKPVPIDEMDRKVARALNRKYSK